MNEKIYYGIITLFTILLFVSNTYALDAQYLGTFKQGVCVELKTTCADCTFVNVTSVIYPDSSQALGQVVMEKIDTEYNYTFCDTSNLGTYTYNTLGNPEGTNIVQPVTFTVTPSGFINTLGFYIVIAGLIVAVVILGVSLGELWFVVIAGMALILFGIYTINFGIADQRDMFMTWAVGLFEIGVGTILALGAGYQKMDVDVW